MADIPGIEDLIQDVTEIHKKEELDSLDGLYKNTNLCIDSLYKTFETHKKVVSKHNTKSANYLQKGKKDDFKELLLSLNGTDVNIESLEIALTIQKAEFILNYAKTRLMKNYTETKVLTNEKINSPKAVALIEHPKDESYECLINYITENFAKYDTIKKELIPTIIRDVSVFEQRNINVYHVATQSKNYPSIEIMKDFYNKLADVFSKRNPALSEEVYFWTDGEEDVAIINEQKVDGSKPSETSNSMMFG